MKPHKHCELIKAWADGHEIEYKFMDHPWETATTPDWSELVEYRIKPERKRYRVAKMIESGGGVAVVAGTNEAKRLESFREFIYWLTDWIEYD